jgi:anhydro-N-acetylmuramic acid kinase
MLRQRLMRHMTQDGLFIGLMSGTSLDGIDGALADFSAPRVALLAHEFHEFAPALRRELELLLVPGADEIHRTALAANQLARAYAAVVRDLLRKTRLPAERVRAIGAHGQTVRHRPDAGYTTQLNAPALLAELTGIDVIADFRARDLAAGGQGAPLVPAFHAACVGARAPRAVVNIGGISNVSLVPVQGGLLRGFDCGPGNTLLDGWTRRHRGEPFDRDGLWAASGRVDEPLLARLLAEPFFEMPPPKSTGRERFNPDWLAARLGHAPIGAADVAATLTQLTACTIARAIRDHEPGAVEVIVCGGGARNATLMRMLAQACAPVPVASSETAGVDPQHVEALAFAWLAREFVARRPGNRPSVTGARGMRVLGALYPR